MNSVLSGQFLQNMLPVIIDITLVKTIVLEENYDFSGLTLPTPLNEIKKFEK